MNRLRCGVVLTLLGVALTASCGGGSSDGGVIVSGPPGESVTGSFTPDVPTPGAKSVSTLGQVGINTLMLTVMVTGTSDVYGASFDLVYDSTNVTFMGWAHGTLLESDGRPVFYQVNAHQAGRVVVGASRAQQVGGADAGVSTALIQLRFRFNEFFGSTHLRFENADLLNSSDPPQNIDGITFSGGTLSIYRNGAS